MKFSVPLTVVINDFYAACFNAAWQYYSRKISCLQRKYIKKRKKEVFLIFEFSGTSIITVTIWEGGAMRIKDKLHQALKNRPIQEVSDNNLVKKMRWELLYHQLQPLPLLISLEAWVCAPPCCQVKSAARTRAFRGYASKTQKIYVISSVLVASS